jgi:hypothetical protein
MNTMGVPTIQMEASEAFLAEADPADFYVYDDADALEAAPWVARTLGALGDREAHRG